MPRFLPVGKDAKGAARFLLAALPALGAILTALAITGDIVGRMARNHPHATFAAFGCAALAVFLGAVAAFALQQGSNEERRVLYAGLGVLGAGLVFTVYAGVKTWGDRPQPSITVKPKGAAAVAVSVRGVGLRSSDHIVVEVEQLLRVTDGHGKHSWKSGQPLYGASLGPDGAGEIDETVDLALPAGDFDDLGARAWVGDEPQPCYTNGNTTGCVRVHVPRTQERPQLAVDWETFVRVPRLVVRLKARNLSPRPARSMRTACPRSSRAPRSTSTFRRPASTSQSRSPGPSCRRRTHTPSSAGRASPLRSSPAQPPGSGPPDRRSTSHSCLR